MQNILDRLKSDMEAGAIDLSILPDVVAEIEALRTKADLLEELLIMLVRTGWPWDEEGEPNEIYSSCRQGYVATIVEAKKQLGLDRLSMITGTERPT
jgi:hypothetical protein